MVNRRDYTAEKVEAARSVLIELVRLLGEYRDHIVLIGGWVPEMLIAGAPMPHVGSMDIDLALDHSGRAFCLSPSNDLIDPCATQNKACNIPEIWYFLKQEYGYIQENTYAEGNAGSTPEGQDRAAPSVFAVD